MSDLEQRVNAEDVEDFVETLRKLSEAYPDDIFLPLTDEQREQHPLVITRASASMGRHFAPYFTRAAAEIERLERENKALLVFWEDDKRVAVQMVHKHREARESAERQRDEAIEALRELVRLFDGVVTISTSVISPPDDSWIPQWEDAWESARRLLNPTDTEGQT